MADGGKDHEADEHPQGAGDEGATTAVILDEIEAQECSAEVHAAQDHLCDVGVLDACATEYGRAVVEEVVRAGELLEGL